MENYITNFQLYNKKKVYDFKLGYGGIGDYIKFFMYLLSNCIVNKEQLYLKKNNLDIEKYIKLKYDIMCIDDESIEKLDCVEILEPSMMYSCFNSDFIIDINEVFFFTDEVKINSKFLFPECITNYISMHLRLGDSFLETDKNYVDCKDDKRSFSEEQIHKFIENNCHENIFFFCDNNSYKLSLKNKYNNIITANCDIGHTSLKNTTLKQILDTVSEFYILTNSKVIYAASTSGFSLVASKFNNIPLINLTI